MSAQKKKNRKSTDQPKRRSGSSKINLKGRALHGKASTGIRAGAGPVSKDMNKTKSQLIDELAVLRNKVAVQEEAHKDILNSDVRTLIERERFQAIFENTPVGIAMVDKEGCLINFNNAFQNMLGYSRNELLGMTFSDITHSDYLEDDMKRFIEMLSSKREHSCIEKMYVRKDGETVTAKLTVTAIRDANGRFLYDIGMVEDITERKREERRTLKALREKEILLREIHHRVKNNMTIVCSLLELQSCHITDEKVTGMFQDLINRINSMSLVHEKLYTSDDLEHINVRMYIKTLTDELNRSLRRPDRQIKTHLFIEEMDLNIDKLVPLGLLVTELITNSHKHAFNHTDKGDIIISLSADDHGRITLKISDNGSGFPEDMDFADYRNTLGVRLAMELASQLDGVLSMSNNEGAEFLIAPVQSTP